MMDNISMKEALVRKHYEACANSKGIYDEEFHYECQELFNNELKYHSDDYKFIDSKFSKEDLFQATMLSLIEKKDEYNHDYAFATWYTKNCKDMYRALKRKNKCDTQCISIEEDMENEHPLIERLVGACSVEDTYLNSQKIARDILNKAINEMNDNYREALMRKVQGDSVAAISQDLKLPISTINNWISRGKKHLRDFCESEELKEDLYLEL